jgi:hypothetical protein
VQKPATVPPDFSPAPPGTTRLHRRAGHRVASLRRPLRRIFPDLASRPPVSGHGLPAPAKGPRRRLLRLRRPRPARPSARRACYLSMSGEQLYLKPPAMLGGVALPHASDYLRLSHAPGRWYARFPCLVYSRTSMMTLNHPPGSKDCPPSLVALQRGRHRDRLRPRFLRDVDPAQPLVGEQGPYSGARSPHFWSTPQELISIFMTALRHDVPDPKRAGDVYSAF